MAGHDFALTAYRDIGNPVIHYRRDPDGSGYSVHLNSAAEHQLSDEQLARMARYFELNPSVTEELRAGRAVSHDLPAVFDPLTSVTFLPSALCGGDEGDFAAIFTSALNSVQSNRQKMSENGFDPIVKVMNDSIAEILSARSYILNSVGKDSFAEELADGERLADFKKYISLVFLAGDRFSLNFEEMTMAQRMMSDSLPVQKTYIDFTEYIRNYVFRLRETVGTGAEIRFDTEGKSICTDVDVDRMFFAVSAVISNAFEACREIPRIAIHLKEEGGNAVLTVSDNGVGMTEDEAEKVFDPYAVLEREWETVHHLGLGLPLARAVLKSHGGDLVLIPDREGVTARFSFPIERENIALHSGISAFSVINSPKMGRIFSHLRCRKIRDGEDIG